MPSTTADMVGTRICGQFVELFESSADKKWRKMEDPETGEEGWMLLHHGQIGALVRPVTEDTTADAREVGKVPTRGVLLDVSHHVFG
eukprot:g1553.t1